ncbi:Thymus-specific serine protease [Balamuthia mandrillaris]
MKAVLLAAVALWVVVQLCGATFFRTDLQLQKQFLQNKPTHAAKELWYTQKLDHFNKQDRRTWQQRYFVNESFWNADLPGPIFLQIGGEAPISGADASLLQMANYGRRHGALLVALEHRFYGQSQPLPSTETANLVYLSSQQALADAAEFILWLKQQYNAVDSPVITFGCSYPGNLAAWFRLKYPHITLASVASSAPVLATLDFFQYLDVVEQSLNYFTGIQCEENIQTATQTIQKMLQSASGQSQLQKLFNTCTVPRVQEDISTFMSNLMGNWMGTVQYNDEGGNPVDITYLCNILNSGSSKNDPVVAYANISNMFLKAEGQSCMDISYKTQVAMLSNTTPAAEDNMRPWVYQTCTEFGYFQTTDSDAQPFGNLVPLSYSIELCEDAFGISNFTPDINGTNAYYGGRHLDANGPTNILFVNGNIDPWHSLGVTKNLSPSLRSILIDGTAHCANVLPSSPNDPPSLVLARKKIAAQIDEWLSNA